jgi:hypothetical protein
MAAQGVQLPHEKAKVGQRRREEPMSRPKIRNSRRIPEGTKQAVSRPGFASRAQTVTRHDRKYGLTKRMSEENKRVREENAILQHLAADLLCYNESLQRELELRGIFPHSSIPIYPSIEDIHSWKGLMPITCITTSALPRSCRNTDNLDL